MQVAAVVGAGDRRLPRCAERQGLHRRGRADLPHQDRRDFRPARGRADRARRGLRVSIVPTASSAISAAARSNWSMSTAPASSPAPRCRSAASLCRTAPAARSRRPRRSSRMRSTTSSCCGAAKAARFYAVGGTWRALAQLHMAQMGYPLHVMHGYVIRAQGGAGILPAGAPGPSGHAVADRGRERRPPSAVALCRAGAGAHRAQGRAARCGVLGARRARGPALLAARRRGAQEGCAARGRAGIEPAALALAAAWRGADRLDRCVHGDVRHRRELRGEAAAPCRMPGGRHRLARASRLSRRAVAEHHRACGLRRHRPSGPRLYRAGDLLSPRRPPARRGTVAAHPRTGLDPHARSRPRARRGAARGLHGVGLAAGRAAAHAAQGRAASSGAAARGRDRGARRRARLVAAEAAGAARRPRAGGDRPDMADEEKLRSSASGSSSRSCTRTRRPRR